MGMPPNEAILETMANTPTTITEGTISAEIPATEFANDPTPVITPEEQTKIPETETMSEETPVEEETKEMESSTEEPTPVEVKEGE